MTDVNLKQGMNCPAAILTLKQVGDLIHRKDIECIKKWLNGNSITIHRLGKLTCVYKVDFDCAMMLPQIKDFKKKYPEHWQSYYQKTIKDEALFNLIMLRMEVDINFQPITRVKVRSKSDQKLYQKLFT
ncbi:hypothetical protein L1S34_04390 [Flavobacterium sp. K77]|uniref:hypothetical protein n=1 Tax=Flavobacterium sp. K77 TaxID=2910676 RepID=UPI001F25D2AD|nr:hypothetical protein [Flavobacterium sp. K77]MCF6140517.1 hypothetical protein [Flavobacterium sp. K77]